MTEAELQDSILRHALQLQRLSAGEQARADDILRQLEAELRTLLQTADLEGAARAELKKLIAEAERLVDPRYQALAEIVDSQGIIAIVAEHTAGLVSGMAAPSQERLASLSRGVLIEGAPSSAWWARQSEDTTFRFAQAVRQGVVNGETLERIVARVAGREGFMEASRRNARALVHSSVMSASNAARLAVFRKNADMFSGVRWLATLDGITCRRCAALDGQAWDLEGNKLPGTDVEFMAPPIHWNDRCQLSGIPRTDALDEVFPGISAQFEAALERASQDGPVKGTMTFGEFLKRQSPEFIEATLGKGRAELFRQGKITVRDLIGGTGRELTLDELSQL